MCRALCRLQPGPPAAVHQRGGGRNASSGGGGRNSSSGVWVLGRRKDIHIADFFLSFFVWWSLCSHTCNWIIMQLILNILKDIHIAVSFCHHSNLLEQLFFDSELSVASSWNLMCLFIVQLIFNFDLWKVINSRDHLIDQHCWGSFSSGLRPRWDGPEVVSQNPSLSFRTFSWFFFLQFKKLFYIKFLTNVAIMFQATALTVRLQLMRCS